MSAALQIAVDALVYYNLLWMQTGFRKCAGNPATLPFATACINAQMLTNMQLMRILPLLACHNPSDLPWTPSDLALLKDPKSEQTSISHLAVTWS